MKQSWIRVNYLSWAWIRESADSNWPINENGIAKITSKQSRKHGAPGFHETQIKIFFVSTWSTAIVLLLVVSFWLLHVPSRYRRFKHMFWIVFLETVETLTRGDNPSSKHEDRMEGKKSFSIIVGLENCCNQSRRKMSAAVPAEKIFFNWNLLVEDFLSSIASGSLSARVFSAFSDGKLPPFPCDRLIICVSYLKKLF